MGTEERPLPEQPVIDDPGNEDPGSQIEREEPPAITPDSPPREAPDPRIPPREKERRDRV
ncbi:hypothetical protein E8E95_12930 [Pseudomonas sp. BN414]|uniref:hypothetical protein n=1 Tax=Pseudomonas sp. BN414 TaxID=2567888 RepID=UPI00245502CE|nr:hypothetical protein [Pseudomonas sp. BN414]MDH4567585.1 hypothetical protein [Pseudomonas sp. BN414]